MDYIFGRAESTGGLLWVVGKDPDLFNYFLPERWRRTPKKKLSSHNQVFRTSTKDNINLVWRVSRMGESAVAGRVPRAIKTPSMNMASTARSRNLRLRWTLSRRGVKTIYPRAIYMTGSKREPDQPGGG